jgi:hypothetical protein
VLVSHFHWDREWHRTFEAYRARLVDAVDRVLDLVAADPGYRFLLDGQAVLLEDYLAVRPERRAELERGLRDGRLAAGPWYVQPDSLLPSGEAHVRNLLMGRRVAGGLGPVSRVGYVPDSFGHPAQLPQLLVGFGIDSFVYWRGNGVELDALGPWYWWEAPDGSRVRALCLRDGYFGAACLPDDAGVAASTLADRLHARADEPVPALVMNGFDHMAPDAHTATVADALAQRLDARVVRGLLDDVLAARPDPVPSFRGDLVGARLTNLLPGVWSAHMAVKLRNRRCETLLEGWAEPWAAFAHLLGLPDETPAVREAWRLVLQDQAHDSLCGCSIDAVMRQVRSRHETAEGLARETIARMLSRLAGLDVDRRTPASVEQDVVVFNPSPHPRTDVVRVRLDPYPAMRLPLGVPEFPPSADPPGFTIEGRPVRVVAARDPERVRWLPTREPLDVELVVRDVPAFGCRRVRLVPAAPAPDEVDDGREIAADLARVAVRDDGTLDVTIGGRTHRGLGAVEDRGDRGDTYDFDPVADDPGATVVGVTWERRRHASGLASLVVRRVLSVPCALDAEREARSSERVELPIVIEARVAPGVARVDLTVTIDNTARDHRLRLLFATGAPAPFHRAATTFDVATRPTAPPADASWVHPAPPTFAHQGWIEANGLTVAAPGLPEAEVTPDGTIAVTLVRAVGWLARYDLRSRPIPAGPPMEAPAAQCIGPLTAQLAILPGPDPRTARDAELGLEAVLGGPDPLLTHGASLLTLDPSTLVLSALKRAEDRNGIVVRVLNPTDTTIEAHLNPSFAVGGVHTLRLDETPTDEPAAIAAGVVHFQVPPHALRSVLLEPRADRADV